MTDEKTIDWKAIAANWMLKQGLATVLVFVLLYGIWRISEPVTNAHLRFLEHSSTQMQLQTETLSTIVKSNVSQEHKLDAIAKSNVSQESRLGTLNDNLLKENAMRSHEHELMLKALQK
jgi:hypothetical protein